MNFQLTRLDCPTLRVTRPVCPIGWACINSTAHYLESPEVILRGRDESVKCRDASLPGRESDPSPTLDSDVSLPGLERERAGRVERIRVPPGPHVLGVTPETQAPGTRSRACAPRSRMRPGRLDRLRPNFCPRLRVTARGGPLSSPSPADQSARSLLPCTTCVRAGYRCPSD